MGKQRKRYQSSHQLGKQYWIYGVHAVDAALDNPERTITKLLCTKERANEFDMDQVRRERGVTVEIREGTEIALNLPSGAVHQGMACLVEPLDGHHLEEVLECGKPLILLDQVTDPHNVGAILRSAAAFDIGAVIMPKDNTARENAAMAKTACGALDIVPLVTVTNLVQAMEACKKAGYWLAGLDGHTEKTIGEEKLDAKTALVLGAEGDGLRERTRANCDFIVKLPMSEQMESLNVSNAAAIAMYELYRK